MPIVAINHGISPPEQNSPSNGGQGSSSPYFEWTATTPDAWLVEPVHFQIQVADDAGFTSLVRNVFSSQTPGSFEYESSPGVWTPLPSVGLSQVDLGKKIRYAPGLSSLQIYYWRVGVEQLV